MSQSLHEQLIELRNQLSALKQKDYQRDLPFAELVFDRWQRAKTLGFAEGASIYDSSLVFGEVKVGENTWIGPNTVLDGSVALVHIGAYCNISAGAQLYSHDTIQWCLSAGQADKNHGAVTVGDCTYIGPNTIIQCGIDVGKHCVVGANSLVNRSLPDYSFAGGVPCKVLGKVEQDSDGKYKIKRLKDGKG